jgi:hypothetical protein
VNFCRFWTHIQAITKSTSPLMMKNKIAFITPFEIFSYTKMVFSLKNGGAKYQKCVHTVLES